MGILMSLSFGSLLLPRSFIKATERVMKTDLCWHHTVAVEKGVSHVKEVSSDLNLPFLPDTLHLLWALLTYD